MTLLPSLGLAGSDLVVGCSANEESVGCVRWVARHVEAEAPHFGWDAAAPALGGAAVVVLGSGDRDWDSGGFDYNATVAAYDADTGALLWSQVRDGGHHGYDLPTGLAVSPDGRTAYVASRIQVPGAFAVSLLALDAATGAERWRADWADGEYARASSLHALDDRVLVTGVTWRGGYDWTPETGPLCPEGTEYDVVLASFEAATGALEYARVLDLGAKGSDFPTAVAYDPWRGQLLVSGRAALGRACHEDYRSEAWLAAVRPADGEVVRETRHAAFNGSAQAAGLAVGEDHVVLTASQWVNPSSFLEVVAFGPDLEPRWAATTPTPPGQSTRGGSVVLDEARGRALVAVTRERDWWDRDLALRALDLATGSEVWEAEYAGDAVERTARGLRPAVAPFDGLVFGSETLEDPSQLVLSADGARIYVAGFLDFDFGLLALDADAGDHVFVVRHGRDVRGGWFSHPVLSASPGADVVHLAGMHRNEGTVMAVEVREGALTTLPRLA